MMTIYISIYLCGHMLTNIDTYTHLLLIFTLRSSRYDCRYSTLQDNYQRYILKYSM